MRETARQLGLTERLEAARRDVVDTLDILDRHWARMNEMLMMLGVKGVDGGKQQE